MEMRLAVFVLIACSLYYAADSAAYAVTERPLLAMLGLESLSVTMGVGVVFNLAFALFAWLLYQRLK